MTTERDALARRWDLAVHSAQFGVWDLDVPGDIVHYPSEWKRLLGYEATDTADPTATWRSRVHPDDLPGMMAALSAHLAGDEASYECEFRLRAADGRWHWVFSRGRVVERDPDGQARRMVGTLTDLTDRKAAEQARAERDRAEAANRAKTEFLSRMSHELRTPLNAVLGFAQLLDARLGHDDVEEQRRWVRHIEEAGWHLLAMIEDVLDLSRIESGQISLQSAPAAIAPLVRQACDMLMPMADTARVSVRLEEPMPDDVVQVDARRVKQVLTNLLSNAIKYNRPGGTVDVAVAAGRDEWSMVVADTGLGIPAARRGELFQPFNRLGREKEGIDGVGIGLLLTRWLVERMGGRLDLDSEEGVGSTFRVTLPRLPRVAKGSRAAGAGVTPVTAVAPSPFSARAPGAAPSSPPAPAT